MSCESATAAETRVRERPAADMAPAAKMRAAEMPAAMVAAKMGATPMTAAVSTTMATAVTATVAATTFRGSISGHRQHGHDNKDGKPEMGFQHG